MPKAVKSDKGKVSFSSVPQMAMSEVARTFTHGATKYGKFNYSKGMEYTRLYDAACRHMHSWLTGTDTDTDSGRPHLANAISSLMMLLDNTLTGKGVDDRNKVYKKR